jgi:iron complex transport system substrate-binding protein
VVCLSQAAAHTVGLEALEVRDDRGKTLRLTAPAVRIISLAPHLTEIAFAAGAKLIAVSAYSDYPPEAQRLPRVGDGARVDIERILTLKPDLVLAWKSGNQAGDIARLERLGIPVWVSEASQLADIPRLLRDVAKLAGTAAEGGRAASDFESELQRLRNRYSGPSRKQQPVRVFYEIWHQPLLTINGAHMISDAITLCGGKNVFADVPVLTPAVSLESVLAVRPHLVLGGGSANGETDFRTRWRSMPLAALRAVPAHYIAPDSIQRQSPRIIGGIRSICAQVDAAHARAEITAQ